MWTKDYKNYYYIAHAIPNVLPVGNTTWTKWFNYSDFGEAFKEFTFVFNYTKIDLEGSGTSQTLGMSVDMEWDATGELSDNEAAHSANDIIETETTWSANQVFAVETEPGNVVVLVPDIDLDSGAVGSANIMRFRFKLGWDIDTSKEWDLGTIVQLAIIPM
tara:strand:+ start:1132 stop:1614 length:483 start_codon:yes stop_codon:yes gene_type:complete